jgi:hypothetical protein
MQTASSEHRNERRGKEGGERKDGPPTEERKDGMGDGSLQSQFGANLHLKRAKNRINVTKGGGANGVALTDEYFDIPNIKYYDAILGTPFLRRLGIILDFSSPGAVQVGNENIPMSILQRQIVKRRPTSMGK